MRCTAGRQDDNGIKTVRQGMGHALLAVAKEQAFLECRRAVILETQSCNVNAVGFYLHEGFTLIGMDTCCYSNTDLKRKEVRIELGWFPEKREKLIPGEVEIREVRLTDHCAVERMAQEAFWNRYQKGCMEHYLVYKLWESEEYLPEISWAAVKDGEIIGAVLYSRSCIKDGEKCHDTITFGPLCISPKWHGSGVGKCF